MIRFLCRLVPASTVLVVLGCFGSHGIGGGRDAGRAVDAGPALDGSSASDAGRAPIDAGRPVVDAGTCSDSPVGAPIDLACNTTVIAGIETALMVAMGGDDACFCAETIRCRAGVDEPGVLELFTEICPHSVDCDGCQRFIEGTCDMPALTEGPWRVEVNGSFAFDLNVGPADVVPERADDCIRVAARDDRCGIEHWTYRDRHDLLCHPTHAQRGQRVAIELTDDCGSCGDYAGPCQVRVLDDTILVRPSAVHTACDVDCPDVCMPRQDICYTPPLAAGDYRVIVESETMSGYESRLEVIGGLLPPPETTCGPYDLRL